MLVSEAAGAVLTGLGADTVFGVVGSGNFHVTNALRAHGVEFFATRHEGGAATLHANSAADGPARFAALAALAGLPAAAVTSLVASALRVVVHLRRGAGGRREVAEVGLLARERDELVVRSAWSARTGNGPVAADLRDLLVDGSP